MANEISLNLETFPLEEYFRPGVLPEDLPGVHALLQAKNPLDAFIALFRGTDDNVLIRILVLREIGARGEAPYWTARELETWFAYLDQTKLNSVLLHLKKSGLLIYVGETACYNVSPFGRMALAALETLLKFSFEEGGEIGYITSQLSAGKSFGRVSAENLQHLLSRLRELEDEFTQAIVSGSEHRIQKAENKLGSVWSWVSKGTEIIGEISTELDTDPVIYKVAQRIGQVQSRMLHMTSMFQRTLNQIERQKVHLGASGLSSSDINAWLRQQNEESLASMVKEDIVFNPRTGFILSDIALDVTEYILIERIRDATEPVELPPPSDAPAVDEIHAEPEDLSRLIALQKDLEHVETDAPLHELVPATDFPTSSYRLTLVSLLNNNDQLDITGPVAELAKQPFAMELDDSVVEVNNHGVKSMTGGRLVRRRSV
jgi:hypothetical protein